MNHKTFDYKTVTLIQDMLSADITIGNVKESEWLNKEGQEQHPNKKLGNARFTYWDMLAFAKNYNAEKDKQRWIKCAEPLPKHKVLARNDRGGIAYGVLNTSKFQKGFFCDEQELCLFFVTHWMELPKI